MSDQTTAGLLAELATVSGAVLDAEWSTGGLASLPAPADFGVLLSSADPLAALDSAGVGVLTPHVAFLAKPLDQFRGDPGAVTTPAQGMATAATDIRTLADTLRQAATTGTSGWTGEAADGHRATGAQFAEGLTAISEAAKTISGAVVGAGEEVVKALTRIIGLIEEAVRKMIPVMADGIARAPLTGGASLVEAIRTCVDIATACGAEIADVMANLLANATNLMKLVDLVLTVVDAVTQLLQKLAKAAEGSGGDAPAAEGTPATALESEKTATGQSQLIGSGAQATEGTATSTGTGQATSGVADQTGDTEVAASRPAGTTSAASLPITPGSTASTSSGTSLTGTAPLGGVATTAGAVSATGASGTRPPNRLAPGGSTSAIGPKETTASRQADTVPAATTPTGGSTTPTAMPMAMPAATRGEGADDTEHQRRYEINADDDTFAAGDQDAIAATGVIGAPATPEDEWPGHATPAEPQPAAAPQDEARPAKVVWRLGADGALEAVPVIEPPKDR
ncbi:hypothetical protein B0I31_12458 [Saccharothrix carnea]|uniref:Type VII secretion system (Wss) protein ESAT-6 n=1 Tax=Saccharothrix carnea TaxID=1280637 RepID=A0A2P8HR41_SACCR|nr:hypothetical protein [Saccharothrix carnea]PSL48671.1 hypothetical protein B0I31_12458 [Saccharothrix carnea]